MKLFLVKFSRLQPAGNVAQLHPSHLRRELGDSLLRHAVHFNGIRTGKHPWSSVVADPALVLHVVNAVGHVALRRQMHEIVDLKPVGHQTSACSKVSVTTRTLTMRARIFPSFTHSRAALDALRLGSGRSLRFTHPPFG